MIEIFKVEESDLEILADLSRITFMEAHKKSAPLEVLETYMDHKYALSVLKEDINNPNHHYYFIVLDGIKCGFSKIIMNTPCSADDANLSLAKLDRIYILEAHYGKGLGHALFDFNVKLAKNSDQKGIWLYTWIENKRAINFYLKVGFQIIGSYLFKLDETRANPNHIMRYLF